MGGRKEEPVAEVEVVRFITTKFWCEFRGESAG